MTLIEFLILLLVAGICGGLAQALVGYSRGGCLLSIVIGFIGALVGRWIANKLALPDFFELNIGGHNFPVLWSIIGGAVFTGIINLLSPREDFKIIRNSFIIFFNLKLNFLGQRFAPLR